MCYLDTELPTLKHQVIVPTFIYKYLFVRERERERAIYADRKIIIIEISKGNILDKI